MRYIQYTVQYFKVYFTTRIKFNDYRIRTKQMRSLFLWFLKHKMIVDINTFYKTIISSLHTDPPKNEFLKKYIFYNLTENKNIIKFVFKNPLKNVLKMLKYF